jgi:hypothetical protein
MFRRGGSPAARSEGRRRLRNSRRFGCTSCRGLGLSEEGIPMRSRSGGGGVDDDNGAPAVNTGEEPAHENQ